MRICTYVNTSYFSFIAQVLAKEGAHSLETDEKIEELEEELSRSLCTHCSGQYSPTAACRLSIVCYLPLWEAVNVHVNFVNAYAYVHAYM